MHIIVVGAGEVGSYMAEILSREHHDVVVVDIDQQALRAVESTLDVETVHGSATLPSVLQRAGARRCDLLVAVTATDNTNMIVSLLAKQQGVPRTVVRLEEFELRRHDARDLHEAVKADLVIDPDEQTAREIIDLLDYPGVAEVADMGGGEIVVLGARLPADAPLVGRTLAELGREYDPEWEFLFGTITRGDQTIIPRGDHSLEAHDLVRIVVKRRFRAELLRLIGLESTGARRVMLLGGGRIAELVADLLSERGVEVVVIERDLGRAQELAARCPRIDVMNADITDADLLADLGVGSFDAVIALTGEDDANVLSCLYAKQAGARETIAVIHRLSLLPLLTDIGIDASLSPRTASANQVLRFVRGDVAQVATFLEGEVEVLELEVKEGSPADGAIVAELRMPKDVLVGARIRDGKAEIARGRSVLRDRDHVVIFSKPGSVDAVHQIFG